MDGLLVPGTVCDHKFVSSQSTPQYGRFYSPRYPSSYPKNIRCSYLFRARLKERIRLVFEEISLQKGDLSCLNRADLIRVHDGKDSGAPTIAVLCNQGAEVEVLSTGPDLYVEFVANSEWPGQGFKAMFQFQPLDDAPHSEPDKVPGAVTGNPKYSVIGPAVSATTSLCDMVYNSDSTKTGVVMSPGYPNSYPARSQSQCTYDFQARGKERVQVIFQDLNLYHTSSDSNNCEGNDGLMAYVYIDGKKERIDSFCGETPPRPIMSNGPRLSLEFHGMTSSRYSRGFKATYSFMESDKRRDRATTTTTMTTTTTRTTTRNDPLNTTLEQTVLHAGSYSARIVKRGAGIVIVDYNCKVGRAPKAETVPGRKETKGAPESFAAEPLGTTPLEYAARCRTARRRRRQWRIFCNVDPGTILTTVIPLESVINSPHAPAQGAPAHDRHRDFGIKRRGLE
ncbi:Cubilin [Ooceraea biroi]|uniref:Cubilin n=1 Tax=Ooceraea biroi TaxID=2015173 RepID=A0A026WTQ3_OOCBI|nr:Cubilin [Ooceraea biroi]